MGLTFKEIQQEEEVEMTSEELKERVQKLQKDLEDKGLQDNEMVAQLMALRDQLQAAEIEKAEMKAREVETEKQYRAAMAKVDEAAEEKRRKAEEEKHGEIRLAEARKYTQALRDKDDKIKDQAKQLEELRQKLNIQESGFQGMSQKDSLQATIFTLEKENKALRQRIEELEKLKVANERLEISMDKLREENSRLEEELNDALDRAIELEGRVLEGEKAEMKVRVFEEEEEEQNKKEAELIGTRLSIATQVVRLEASIVAYKRTIDEHKATIDEHEQTIAEKSQIIEDLRGMASGDVDLAKLAQKNAALTRANQKLQKEFEKVKKANETFKARDQGLTQANGDLTKETINLQIQVRDSQNQVAKLREQAIARQQEVFGAKKMATDLRQQLNTLKESKQDDGANADEISRLKKELKKATKEISRLHREAEETTKEIHRLNSDAKDTATEIRRLRKIEDTVQIQPYQAKMSDLEYQVSQFDAKEKLWTEISDEWQAELKQAEVENKKLTAEQKRLLSVVADVEKKLRTSDRNAKAAKQKVKELEAQVAAASGAGDTLVEQKRLLAEAADLKSRLKTSEHVARTAQKALKELESKVLGTGASGTVPEGLTDREQLQATKIKELEGTLKKYLGQNNTLTEENKKLRKTAAKSDHDEGKLQELLQDRATASLNTIQVMMGIMVFRRALNGMDPRDMDAALLAVDQARHQAGIVSDDRLIGEVAFWGGIALYYAGDAKSALQEFDAIKDSDNWDDKQKDLLGRWIVECESGVGCPAERSGYREAIGFGSVAGSLRQPPIHPHDRKGKEERKAKRAAKKAARKAKRKGKKPRRALAPRRRGIHKPPLYVGILSPFQQQIWNTIDFDHFDYDKLNAEQQSLFSFEPIDDEPDSPPPRPPEYPPFEYPKLPSSRASSEESEHPPPKPPRPPRRERERPPASAASSAASIVDQGDQRPSRMSDLTVDAALHIQYLTAQLAEGHRRIHELENTHGDILTTRNALHRREGQVQELRKHNRELIAELRVWRTFAQDDARHARQPWYVRMWV